MQGGRYPSTAVAVIQAVSAMKNRRPTRRLFFQRADGRMKHGVSDAAGFTHEVSSHLPETIKLFLEE